MNRKKLFVIICLSLIVGCASMRKISKHSSPEISNPFTIDTAQSSKSPITIRRSFGLNAIEIALGENSESTLVRYTLAELKSSHTDGLQTIPSSGDDNSQIQGQDVVALSGQSLARQSYLLGLAKVKEHFRKKDYELALVTLESLVESYPSDTKLLSLRGTVASKVGMYDLARESWSLVLKEDPANTIIRQAISRLPASSPTTLSPKTKS
ncbi:MAG: hypothetical protein HYS98_03205 [Deltaproteobacteria bacterium]|nr:hypothetical protein [Deltaproteobacteria bacterium]